MLAERFTSVSTSQLRNASFSILRTLSVIVRAVSPQSANAPAPIVVMTASSANVAVAILLHLLNALAPILVTDLGKSNDCSCVRLANALVPMVLSSELPRKLNSRRAVLLINAEPWIAVNCEPLGTLTTSSAEQLKNTSANVVSDVGSVTSLSLVQFMNTPVPNLSIVAGSAKVRVSRASHWRKACCPNSFTVAGISIEVSHLARRKA